MSSRAEDLAKATLTLVNEHEALRKERDEWQRRAVAEAIRATTAERERDEARVELATERERLNVEVDRLIGQCERLTSERDEARVERDRLAALVSRFVNSHRDMQLHDEEKLCREAAREGI